MPQWSPGLTRQRQTSERSQERAFPHLTSGLMAALSGEEAVVSEQRVLTPQFSISVSSSTRPGNFSREKQKGDLEA